MDKLYEAETKYQTLSRHFDSMYEYKERLEKSFVNLKNEKSSLLEVGEVEREDFNAIRATLERRIQILENDLTSCRKSEFEMLNSASGATEKPLAANSHDAAMVPLLSPLSMAKQNFNTSSPKQLKRIRLPADKIRSESLKDEKEAIQSPIAHVPGQPSGDPNEDTVDNVLI